MKPVSKYSVAPVGERFFKWTVTAYSHSVYKGGKAGSVHYWDCVCDCGTVRKVCGRTLTRGQTQSCGCFKSEKLTARQTTHGILKGTFGGKQKRAAEYTIWSHIKDRCTNPNNSYWHRYGGRGIRRCEGFQDFAVFMDVMGSRPSKIHSIDRINNDGNYSCGRCSECVAKGWPSNCRWATPVEQSRNSSRYKGGKRAA